MYNELELFIKKYMSIVISLFIVSVIFSILLSFFTVFRIPLLIVTIILFMYQIYVLVKSIILFNKVKYNDPRGLKWWILALGIVQVISYIFGLIPAIYIYLKIK